MTSTDKELITSLRQGNETVFETLFREYYERLCNYAYTIMKDIDEAEEMVQATFLAVWEKHDRIEIHTSVKSYLYRAVHNHCLNRVKHDMVKQEYNREIRYLSSNDTDSTADVLMETELEKQITLAIDALPKQCARVFRLSRFENLTYAEIATQLNLSVKTVNNHMSKALKILREKLRDYIPLLLLVLIFKN